LCALDLQKSEFDVKEEECMMTENSGIIPAPTLQRLTVLETWRLALTGPNEETYQQISQDPSASLGRAIGWITLSSGVAYAIAALAQLLIIQLFPFSSFLEGAEEVMGGRLLSGMSTMFVLVCGLPFSVLFSIFGALLFAGLIHFIAGALGGSGSFDRLVYVCAAISAPVSILSGVLGLIPIVNCLTLPLALYALVLNILAIKVVYKISWGAAMGAILILLVLFALVIVVIGLAVWEPLQEFLRSPEFLPSEIY
jgi:hypothetical protein